MALTYAQLQDSFNAAQKDIIEMSRVAKHWKDMYKELKKETDAAIHDMLSPSDPK